MFTYFGRRNLAGKIAKALNKCGTAFAIARRCDARDKAAVGRVFNALLRRQGLRRPIYVAVCIGGNIACSAPRLTLKILDETMRLNVAPSIWVLAQIERLSRNGMGGGCIILSSTAGVRPAASSPNYCAAKAAVNQLVTIFAKTCAPGFRVNAFAPGMIGGASRRRRIVTKRTLPLGGFDNPREIASLAAWMLWHETYMTGQVIVSDGGMPCVTYRVPSTTT